MTGLNTILQEQKKAASKADSLETCAHCGDSCAKYSPRRKDLAFCCTGCKSVYLLLEENDMQFYYQLENQPGIRMQKKQSIDEFAFLEEENLQSTFIQFKNENKVRLSFSIPQIHCSSCVWLLENLNRIEPALLSTTVDFSSRCLDLEYDSTRISFKEVVVLLSKIGYRPDLSESSDDKSQTYNKTILYQIGVAGFCFGNIMLLSFPEYLGLNSSEVTIQRFLKTIVVLLSLPVLFYSAKDYFKQAWLSIYQGRINLDVPVVIGISALFVRSLVEVINGSGSGYFDSLSGFVFFLLLGKWFQDKTYRHLSYGRDSSSFYPMSVLKINGNEKQWISLDQIQLGDIVEIKHNQVIPVEGRLLSNSSSIDYSFVTGESVPVYIKSNENIYSGGLNLSQSIQIEVSKAPSTQNINKIWQQHQKTKSSHFQKIVEKVSRYFTLSILSIALLTGIYWGIVNPKMIWISVSAVLIIACPCALALTLPFTFGNLNRIFGKHGLYLKDNSVIESLSVISSILFDKTGTLTSRSNMEISYHGDPLKKSEKDDLFNVFNQSTHPFSERISNHLDSFTVKKLDTFKEIPGLGISAKIDNNNYKVGHRTFAGPKDSYANPRSSLVYVEVNNRSRGYFLIKQKSRKGVKQLISNLKGSFGLYLLSGDRKNNGYRDAALFEQAKVQYDCKPKDKEDFVRDLKSKGENVLMVGDGLNDEKALRISNVGITVSENLSDFYPNSDAILNAKSLDKIPAFLLLSKKAIRIAKWSFLLSIVYNIVGLIFATSGNLSPIVAAILMPLSSISVVVFTTLAVSSVSARIFRRIDKYHSPV